MANLLGDCGYKTSMIGKWQLGFFKNEYLPWNSKGLIIFFSKSGVRKIGSWDSKLDRFYSNQQ